MREMQLFLNGQWQDGVDSLTVRSPFDGRDVARVARGGPDELERAAESAERATESMAALPPSERAAILEGTAALVFEHREKLAAAIQEHTDYIKAETLGDSLESVTLSDSAELTLTGHTLKLQVVKA